MRYIDYKEMKDFYTIAELCQLFEIDKQGLKQSAEKYGIGPMQDAYGNWRVQKIHVRKLHNCIYKESQNSKSTSQTPWSANPWA